MSALEYSVKHEKEITELDFDRVLKSLYKDITCDDLHNFYKNVSSLFDGETSTLSKQLDGICVFLDLMGNECTFD